jgi:hypothetical protein
VGARLGCALEDLFPEQLYYEIVISYQLIVGVGPGSALENSFPDQPYHETVIQSEKRQDGMRGAKDPTAIAE